MNAYGYTDSNMLPLTKERALELMERDVSVYMLHTDNTEAMAFDAEDIRSFDGIFGVEAPNGRRSKTALRRRTMKRRSSVTPPTALPSISFGIMIIRRSSVL